MTGFPTRRLIRSPWIYYARPTAWTRTHLEAPDSSRPAGGNTMATSRFERSALFAGAALVLWMSVPFAQAPAPTSGVVAVDSTAEKAPTLSNQTARPDFSGRWWLVHEKSDFGKGDRPDSRVDVITHRDPEL